MGGRQWREERVGGREGVIGMKDGFPPPSSWGQALRGNDGGDGGGMGPRIREDNGREGGSRVMRE